MALLLLVLAARICFAQGTEAAECPAETAHVIRSALLHGLSGVTLEEIPERFDSRFPALLDFALLPEDGVIYVRNFVDDPGCLVDATVLPPPGTFSFRLVTDSEIERRADEKGSAFHFVRVWSVLVDPQRALVGVHATLRSPSTGSRTTICCCGGRMRLRMQADIWVFEEWQDVFCA